MSNLQEPTATLSRLCAFGFPQNLRHPQIWSGLCGSAPALAIAEAAAHNPGLSLVVVRDTPHLLKLQEALRFYADPSLKIHTFPDWEILPYDWFAPHEDIISERLETLYSLGSAARGLLLVAVPTLLHRLPPQTFIQRYSLVLNVGQSLNLDQFRQQLEHTGYRCVTEVREHGEFAVRGALIDLFPMGSPHPYRIDLLDEEIESLRIFNPENQRTVERTNQVKLIPGREFPLDPESINQFRLSYRKEFEGDPNQSVLYREISQGLPPAGTESYLPLFFDSTATLFDYLPAQTLVLHSGGLIEAARLFCAQIQDRYEQRRHDTTRPLLKPERLFLSAEELLERITCFPQVELQHESPASCAHPVSKPLPELLIQSKAKDGFKNLIDFIHTEPGRICIVAESMGRREYLLEMLRPQGLNPKVCSGWHEFVAGTEPLTITVAPLDQGLWLSLAGILVIAEAQLFGERAHRQTARRATTHAAEQIIHTLSDLAPGAPVVHLEHGIGRYLGLNIIVLEQQPAEFVTLEYLGGDKLYVPVSSLHLITRYSGAAPENAPLHKLGSDQWQKAKRRAAERVRDVAAELLEVYARRAALAGHAYQTSDQDYQEFASCFPFEETPDQQAAIDQVLADMRSTQPMDRVICGDVGFGKTEVAMRAAFIAVQDGFQVAVLVPTTLLAQQHYQNFRDRFADWPVQIDVISRFRTPREMETLKQRAAAGQIDIIIGTHRLLQKDMSFKNLGLVVLDEEHRFGVQQKERLKMLRAQVDVLTLTATPIPRTLNMALAGLRDLSIISTPPQGRVAIKTFVGEWSNELIKEAIWRELQRGGQVYFLHNEVKTIEQIAQKVALLVPEAQWRIAHGQMRERDLEQVMLDFYHRRFNLLICTTIIESGIDISTANTIIINRADHLGLAQLHQLRGRVGRSHHRAYAYLIVPERRAMTPEAGRRLDALATLEELGSGFMLASHDLEIRGAGELLGEEQSGEIHEIGFSLYSELLERAVESLKQGRSSEVDLLLESGSEVDLGIPALIEADYLPDIHARLILYKRIANAANDDQLRELQIEMIDRFGLLPPHAKTLFRVTSIKLMAAKLGIKKITANNQGFRLWFGAHPNIDLLKVIQLVQADPQVYKFEGQDKLRVNQPFADVSARIAALEKLLDSMHL